MLVNTRTALEILKTNHTKFKACMEKHEIKPDDSKGQELFYDLAVVVQAWISDAQEKSKTSLDRNAEDARLKKAQADLKEMEIEVRQGNLLRREDVEREAGDILVICRNKLLGLPDQLTSLVFGVEDKLRVKTIIKKKVHEALDELSRLNDVTEINKLDVNTFEEPA